MRRPELLPYGGVPSPKKDGYVANIPWDKARAFLFPYCRIRSYPAIALILIAGFALSGCGLMEKALVNLLTPNPENKRIEAQAKESETTHKSINEANTPEKVKAHVETHRMSGKQSHPSLYASVISGLYTEEGRRLAGTAVLAMSAVGIAIWKSVVAYTKGQTVLGLGRFIEKEVKPVVGKEVVRSGVGKELGPLDFKFRKILKKKGIS